MGSAVARSHAHRATPWLRSDAADPCIAPCAWPLTSDGRHPVREPYRTIARIPVVLQGGIGWFGRSPAQEVARRLNHGRPPLSLRHYLRLRASPGGPDARTRQIRKTEPSARPSYGDEPTLASWRSSIREYRRRARRRSLVQALGHILAKIAPATWMLKWRLTMRALWE